MISLREDLAEVREKIAIAQRDYDEAQETKMHHSRTVESLKLDLGELEQNQKRLEILLNNGKSKGHNNLMKYGYFTQELLRAIEEASKRNLFYKKPVGPCGNYYFSNFYFLQLLYQN